jgi:poly-gamma-glutamate synthesis protein (capsule biosynthesis protein)
MRIALAGDTMLGRGVAAVLESDPSAELVAPEVVAILQEADHLLLNLECCVSNRGERWPDPWKPFFFRAPPAAVGVLRDLGVTCVTLANNHVLDFGERALLDTLELLHEGGIAAVGAGADLEEATRPAVLERNGLRLGVVGVTDHPAEYGADRAKPGVAFARLSEGVPEWLSRTIGSLDADAVLVTPHWGPNMAPRPLPTTRAAAARLLAAGATVVAGHSAHVFHGVEGPILYDLGDFLDDYATHPVLRNDLGLLQLLTLDEDGPVRLEAIPLKLDYCRTSLAGDRDADWIAERFVAACAELGTRAARHEGRLVVDFERPSAGTSSSA